MARPFQSPPGLPNAREGLTFPHLPPWIYSVKRPISSRSSVALLPNSLLSPLPSMAASPPSPLPPSSSASPHTLDSLPDDILVQILEALDGPHAARLSTLSSTSLSCRRLADASSRAFRGHSLSLLAPHAPWVRRADGPCWRTAYRHACILKHLAWEPAPPGFAPAPLFAHSATLWKQRLYVFGGRHGEMYSNSLSVLDLSQPPERVEWVEIAVEGRPPSPRRAHAAAEHGGRLYVLGGGVAHMLTCGDMHSVSLEPPHRWRAEPAPPQWARFGHTCVATMLGRRPVLIVFGGASHKPHSSLEGDSVTRMYNLASRLWHLLDTSGAPPRPRYRHGATLIERPGHGTAMVVWGGYLRRCDEAGETLATNEVFLLNLPTRTWEEPRTSGIPPAPRGGQTLTVIGDKILIFGGGQLMDLRDGHGWQERDLPGLCWLDTNTWAYGACRAAGPEPPPRGGHTAQLIGYDDSLALLVLGGRDFVDDAPAAIFTGTGVHLGRAEAHLLRLRGPSPARAAEAEAPEARSGAAAMSEAVHASNVDTRA